LLMALSRSHPSNSFEPRAPIASPLRASTPSYQRYRVTALRSAGATLKSAQSLIYSLTGPLAALTKPLRERKTTPGGDPVLPTCIAARTKAKQELIHQPGAAPPSSSTGRQLNYCQRRIYPAAAKSF
jgi:hypothetical protein